MANPGAKHLFLALTRPSAEDIAWGILHRLNAEYKLGASFHDSKLEMTLPNGAKIMLRGADQKNWIERLEGQEFKLIAIDEAGLYSIDLRKLVYGSLRPMIVKVGGRLMLIGRPALHGRDVDRRREPGAVLGHHAPRSAPRSKG